MCALICACTCDHVLNTNLLGWVGTHFSDVVVRCWRRELSGILSVFLFKRASMDYGLHQYILEPDPCSSSVPGWPGSAVVDVSFLWIRYVLIKLQQGPLLLKTCRSQLC